MEKAVIANDSALFVEAFLKAWQSSAEVQVLPTDNEPEVDIAKAKDFLAKSLTMLNSKLTELRKKATAVDASALGYVFSLIS
ncbi:hypothetical protein EON63_05290 [archaeon]|nr:MAG: hypothetical protein EON63_05290 [archaeon]